MKMKKWHVLLVIVMITSLLFGCGAKASENSAMDFEAEAPGKNPPIEETLGSSSNTQTILPQNRKLIRTVNMTAETEDLDGLLPIVEQELAALGGYMESREIYSNSSKDYQWRRANLTLRIPAENADQLLSQLDTNTNVTSLTEELDDITLKYVATENRIAALKTEEGRLLELMKMAASLTDLLEVEARLTDVQYELETVTSQLRLYDNQVSYATIHLHLQQVTELTVTQEQTVWQRISTGFTNTLKATGTVLVDIFVALIVASPVLVLIAVLAVAVVLIVKASRKRKRRAAPPPAET